MSLPQVLLVLAAFLAPIFGGFVANDDVKVDPGDLFGSIGAGYAPVLQHALLALPVFAALVVLLLQRRVQQIPHPTVAATLMLVVAGLAPSVAVSSYRAVALNVWIEWAAYAVAFLAAVSGLGRRVGPLALLTAVGVGTAWTARVGVLEYLETRRIDPTWRVFCGWNNPNAAAAMLVLGFLCLMGLPKPRERAVAGLANLGVVVAGGLVLCALLLTGSKGGTLLALPTGLVVFGLVGGRRHLALLVVAFVVLALSAVAFLRSMPLLSVGAALLFAVGALAAHRVHVGRMLGAFAFGGLLLAFFASTTPGPAARTGVTGATRLAAASATQDQSATFRLNLWKSAAILAKERPVTGWGLGSYRYESARPGLATATVFAHNSYLQLAAEAGVGALGLFLAFLGLWAWRALRGAARLPEGSRLPFAAAVGGAASVLAHCLVDSDLSYFGLGLAFFLVLGAASLLAADAVAPEFVPKGSRGLAAAGVAALWLLFAFFAWGDLAKSEVRFAQAQGQPGDLAAIEGLAAWDGDAAYLWAVAQGPGAESALRRAFELQPTPKIARYLAKIAQRRGAYGEAKGALYPALAHDPNNLKTLYLLAQVQRASGDDAGALATARRLLAVERTPYFKIRSLDEVVPTETYLARIAFLAPSEAEPARKAALLAAGVKGLRAFADVTAPAVARMAKGDPRAGYAGVTSDVVRENLTVGADAAREASQLYKSLGDVARATELDRQALALLKAMP